MAPPGSWPRVEPFLCPDPTSISRPDAIKESSTMLASFRYLGLGTVVGQKYDAASNADLTMENGGIGDAGDKYTGLDRFGRLVETIWKSGSTELVHSRYGRNRVGGVEWRRDVKAHSLTPEVKTQDNYYRYDGLQQVTRHDRGDLVPSISGLGYTGIDPDTRQQQEIFTFDETGNWMTDYNAASSLSQSRTQNAANEITNLIQIPSAVQPTYDPAGNMRTVPQPADWEQGYDLKWDAWNRLVEIKNGGTVVAGYAYDALSRRIVTTTASGDRHYYYDNQWRALEEHVTIDSSSTIDRRYVWSPFNRWNLIRAFSNSLEENYYVLKDYLDPVAIIDSDAVVEERYSYDAFGSVNIMDADFEPRLSSVCDWNFLFHAEFKDLDTGLYNYGYRYYHTNLGRWLSRDPIGTRGGLNLYGFVGNGSISRIDLIGLAGVSLGSLGLGGKEYKANCHCGVIFKFENDPNFEVSALSLRAQEVKMNVKISARQAMRNDVTDSTDCPCGKLRLMQVISRVVQDAEGNEKAKGDPGGDWREAVTNSAGWRVDWKPPGSNGMNGSTPPWLDTTKFGTAGDCSNPATLEDGPGVAHSSQGLRIMTCAVLEKPGGSNVMLGCLEWGFYVDSIGHPAVPHKTTEFESPKARLLDGTPSTHCGMPAEVKGAIDHWNAVFKPPHSQPWPMKPLPHIYSAE